MVFMMLEWHHFHSLCQLHIFSKLHNSEIIQQLVEAFLFTSLNNIDTQ